MRRLFLQSHLNTERMKRKEAIECLISIQTDSHSIGVHAMQPACQFVAKLNLG